MITSDEIRKAIRNSDGFRALWPDTAIGGDRQAAKIAIDVMELLSNRGIPFEISGGNGVIQEPYSKEEKKRVLTGEENRVLRRALLRSGKIISDAGPSKYAAKEEWCPQCGEYGQQCDCYRSEFEPGDCDDH